MNSQEYRQFVLSKEKSQEEVHRRRMALGVVSTRIDNAITGMSDEMGELNALKKKWIEYGQDLDTVGIVEECGDILFRMEQLLDSIGSNVEAVRAANVRKLNVRYKERCNDTEAMEENRDRTKEREALEVSRGEVHQGFYQPDAELTE